MPSEKWVIISLGSPVDRLVGVVEVAVAAGFGVGDDVRGGAGVTGGVGTCVVADEAPQAATGKTERITNTRRAQCATYT
jgi:hypothetical protein